MLGFTGANIAIKFEPFFVTKYELLLDVLAKILESKGSTISTDQIVLGMKVFIMLLAVPVVLKREVAAMFDYLGKNQKVDKTL